MKSRIIYTLILALGFCGQLFSQNVPTTMNYHGKITNPDGSELNEQAMIIFSVYNVNTGGAALWTENHENVSIENGIFNVLLGSIIDFPENLFNTPNLYLGINVNSDGEMSPRSLLSSVPFAMKSGSGSMDTQWLTNGENIYRENGKVGIGMDNPSTTLDVAGTITATSEDLLGAGVIANGNLFGVMADAPGTGVYTTGGIYGIWAIADLSKSANATAGYFEGKVGVGTIADCQLDVAGGQISVSGKGAPLSGSSLELAYNSASTRGEILTFDRSNNEYKDLRIDGAEIKINGSAGTGNVSIGTVANEGKLHLYNGSFDGPVLFLEGGGSTEGDIAWKEGEHLHIGTRNVDDDSFKRVVTIGNNHAFTLHGEDGQTRALLSASETGSDGAQFTLYDDEGNAAIILDAQHGGQPGDAARIQTETLEITGGSDLAEPFDISGAQAEKGMIMCIDPKNPGMLTPSQHAYDKCVAGIVSGAGGINAGMIMGQQGSIADGKVPVALTGRVYCMTTTENGPIEPGDLLTTSNLQGHAMKVLDHQNAQGAIIGKAMSTLENGSGLVLVLVSLQ